MSISKEDRVEFENIADQMIEFLCKKGHPHMKVIIDVDSAEIVEGSYVHNTQAYIKPAPGMFPGLADELDNLVSSPFSKGE